MNAFVYWLRVISFYSIFSFLCLHARLIVFVFHCLLSISFYLRLVAVSGGDFLSPFLESFLK